MLKTNRYGRFQINPGTIHYARIECNGDGDQLFLLRDAPWVTLEETGVIVPMTAAKRLAPVTPSKILCIGRNYAMHAKELGHDLPTSPLLFLKPPSSILAPEERILLPPESKRVDHEAELGVIIGKRARRVPLEKAMEYVFGYTVVGDITARDLQKADGQWSRAKGFDTFCPVGPEIVTGISANALRVIARVNGEIRQDGNTKDMIFPVPALVSYLSQAMTLEPGDVIATGTPEGVGPLHDGDELEIEIERIGKLTNRVKAE